MACPSSIHIRMRSQGVVGSLRGCTNSRLISSPNSSQGRQRGRLDSRPVRQLECKLSSAAARSNFGGLSGLRRQVRSRRGRGMGRSGSPVAVSSSAVDLAKSVALFFTPGALITAYAWIVLGKGNLSDGLSKLLTVVSQGYLNPNTGGENIPVTEGALSDLAGDQPLFVNLFTFFIQSGGVYKLAFGPKCFIVVSDPVVFKHILRENPYSYDKGVLSEILEPIMGKGLIPADLETWKPRRRAIQPAFHKAYINTMVQMFNDCSMKTSTKLEQLVNKSTSAPVLDMEKEFYNLALDIIGEGVFNYDFNSVNSESPIIDAVYGLLKECEHRSTFYLPYWNIPLASAIVPRQRKFAADIKFVNEELDVLINKARANRTEDDIEALQARNYDEVSDPSLLRFLLDMRGEDATNKQLRDDLMTMLIAGHETTAAVLTWALYGFALHPEIQEAVVSEIDEKIGDRKPTLADLSSLENTRLLLAESLRLYPQPPVLIRRALEDDVLPGGLNGDPNGYPIDKGTDLFLSVWNLHRSPYLWDDPEEFDLSRFTRRKTNEDFSGTWAGYDPEKLQENQLYPNEYTSDFAYVPFGGGPRKCIGDQFAFLEATSALAVLLRRFHFELATTPEEVGRAFGASIHTENGLKMRITRRESTSPEFKEVPSKTAAATSS